MRASTPVTIGMPVYNGARYLRQALDCWVVQDWADFHLIISDNCSTDETSRICQEYACSDPRIVVTRQPSNIGAVANFNFVFSQCKTEFFAWAACDDLWQSSFLRTCLERLQSDWAAVLAHPQVARIDASDVPYGLPIRGYESTDPDPRRRFRTVLSDWQWCFAVYGVYRTEALRKTHLTQAVYGSDHVLVAEGSLLGNILEVPQVLFFHRTCQPRETRAEYAERVSRNLVGAPPRGRYHLPLLRMGLAHVWTAYRASFSFWRRCQFVNDVFARFFLHIVWMPRISSLLGVLIGQTGQTKLIGWLRRLRWYRRWRHVPDDL